MQSGELSRTARAAALDRAAHQVLEGGRVFAEDELAAAVGRGAEQLVILGAGLDTYAYPGALRDCLRIFEVDQPATQAWKRQRLAAASIPRLRG